MLQGCLSQSTSLPLRHTSHPNKVIKHFYHHSHLLENFNLSPHVFVPFNMERVSSVPCDLLAFWLDLIVCCSLLKKKNVAKITRVNTSYAKKYTRKNKYFLHRIFRVNTTAFVYTCIYFSMEASLHPSACGLREPHGNSSLGVTYLYIHLVSKWRSSRKSHDEIR